MRVLTIEQAKTVEERVLPLIKAIIDVCTDHCRDLPDGAPETLGIPITSIKYVLFMLLGMQESKLQKLLISDLLEEMEVCEFAIFSASLRTELAKIKRKDGKWN